MRFLSQLVAVVVFAQLFFAGGANQTLPTTQTGNAPISIPFTLTDQNNLVVSVALNDMDTLNLMLHTAASDVTLTEDAALKTKSIKFTETSKMKSWGGESDSRFSKGNQVRIGQLRRNNITVWENKNSGKDTDGKFGLDLFQNRIVEIDFDQRRIVLHEKLPRKAGKYERLKIENQNGQLLALGSCLIEGKNYSNKFLLHSGYSGGILLDDAFAANTGVDGKITITEESSLKDSFGNTIKVKKGILPEFALGNARISNVPTGFFSGAIGAQKMSVLGGEVLKQFNLIFDIANNDLYIAARRV
ncbi:MAG: aspartyl protease family protein [Acidobacteriota bacterium]|nr:aspartyl protease family protein [Acidobacteriota bacterium]